MHVLELKIPPVILLVAALVGVYYSPALLPFINEYTDYAPQRAIVAWAFSVTGVLVAVAGVVTFKLAKTTTNPVSIENASSLVTNGIYTLTRNPMYLGMLIIVLAMIIKTGHISGAIFAFGFILYMTKFQIKPEERMLSKLFGTPYTQYLQKVRRWI